VFLPGAIWTARQRLWPLRSNEQRAAVYLLCYVTVIVGFFSASTCKLIPYILPAFPALALLLAAYLDGLLRGSRSSPNRQLWLPLKVLAVLVCAFFVAALWLLPPQLSELAQSGPWPAYALGVVCGLWLVVLLVCQRARNAHGALWAVAGGLTLVLYAALWPLAQIAPAMQCRPLIAAIQPGLDRGATLVCMDYLQSINFYARRLLPIDGYIGELKFGYDQAPADVRNALRPKGMPALRSLMNGPQPVYYVAEAGQSARALAREFGGGAAVIASNQRRAIVGNAAAARLTPPQAAAVNG
jgi:hypothetical protein